MPLAIAYQKSRTQLLIVPILYNTARLSIKTSYLSRYGNVPIRLNPVQYNIVPPYDTVPPSGSTGAAHSDNVPQSAHTNLHRTNIEDYGTLSKLDYVSFMVPPSFVQGLNMPKRTDSCLRNKRTKKRKLSRTPIVVPRIIEHSKDANPHLDQVNSLTVITMDLEAAPVAVLEPVPGAPEITRTGV